MDYLGGMTKDELEALLRRLVENGPEGSKVDFKRTWVLEDKAAQAELAKDVSAIANTDDDVHLDDFGYLIIGAERGRLVGGVDVLDGDCDKLQSQITQVLKNYLAPVPGFSLHAFEDPNVGRWGALVIPPSANQPHLLIRDGAAEVVKHDWWVRVVDVTERAGPHDVARILSKATSRAVRPLELQLQRLSLLVEQQRSTPDLTSVIEALRGAPSSGPSELPTAPTLASSVRGLLVRGNTAVEDKLVAEALRVAKVMGEESEHNPWSFDGMAGKQFTDVLRYLEEQTFPLSDSLATIARYDQGGALTDALCRALSVIAKEPQPIGTHWNYATEFRLYPLVLCLYSVVIVAANEGRPDLLRRVFTLTLEQEGRQHIDPIAVAFRKLQAASPLFDAARGQEDRAAVASRVKETMLPRLTGLLAGTSAADAFYVAEFVIGLAFMEASEGYIGRTYPLPGCYSYHPRAINPITRFLKRRPTWLQDALGTRVVGLLAKFDQTAKEGVRDKPWADGFTSGAVEAYGPESP